MSTTYTYILLNPHKPGILAVVGAFHYKHEAEKFAKKNDLDISTTGPIQLWRIRGNVYRNIMTCRLCN